jgi:hypothetical protein
LGAAPQVGAGSGSAGQGDFGLCPGENELRGRAADDLAKPTVGKWRSRFVARRVDGLLDEPRPGAPRQIGDDAVERMLALTLEKRPPDATHWSTRSMARRCGLSQSAVSRIWRAFALQPHRAETFQLSKDPLFIEKVRDIVGLYLNPPDKALVLCVDEKTQIHALDRSQPLLPMRPGQTERRSHDSVRHGTTSLFAALEVQSGRIVGDFHARHRSVEFRKFLDHIEAAVPRELGVHLILDNYGTHKTPLIHSWLARHPRFHVLCLSRISKCLSGRELFSLCGSWGMLFPQPDHEGKTVGGPG